MTFEYYAWTVALQIVWFQFRQGVGGTQGSDFQNGRNPIVGNFILKKVDTKLKQEIFRFDTCHFHKRVGQNQRGDPWKKKNIFFFK